MGFALKRGIKRFIFFIFPSSFKNNVEHHGYLFAFQLFFFQRILRINGKVPWGVHWTSRVIHPDRITIDAESSFRPGRNLCQYINAKNGIVFGKNLRVGPGVTIISANHNFQDFDKHDSSDPIEIGDNCWIGANAVILPGATLGEHVVVGAGSVVTKSFSKNVVIAGIPAKIIRSIEPYGNEA
ncbi:MAG: acyltransferase [Planctomycetota bacterium]|jgi:acetyltransferase-like isoleucine patch superfamily enzyme